LRFYSDSLLSETTSLLGMHGCLYEFMAEVRNTGWEAQGVFAGVGDDLVIQAGVGPVGCPQP